MHRRRCPERGDSGSGRPNRRNRSFRNASKRLVARRASSRPGRDPGANAETPPRRPSAEADRAGWEGIVPRNHSRDYHLVHPGRLRFPQRFCLRPRSVASRRPSPMRWAGGALPLTHAPAASPVSIRRNCWSGAECVGRQAGSLPRWEATAGPFDSDHFRQELTGIA